jgi:hypothetical protein
MSRTRTTAQREHRPQAPKWTAEEEEIILDEIGKSPTNIKVALIAAAERLPVRTYNGCNSHWYTKMANRNDVVGRLTIGRTVTVRNKTRLKPEQEVSHKSEHPQGLWKRIVKLLFGIQL